MGRALVQNQKAYSHGHPTRNTLEFHPYDLPGVNALIAGVPPYHIAAVEGQNPRVPRHAERSDMFSLPSHETVNAANRANASVPYGQTDRARSIPRYQIGGDRAYHEHKAQQREAYIGPVHPHVSHGMSTLPAPFDPNHMTRQLSGEALMEIASYASSIQSPRCQSLEVEPLNLGPSAPQIEQELLRRHSPSPEIKEEDPIFDAPLSSIQRYQDVGPKTPRNSSNHSNDNHKSWVFEDFKYDPVEKRRHANAMSMMRLDAAHEKLRVLSNELDEEKRKGRKKPTGVFEKETEGALTSVGHLAQVVRENSGLAKIYPSPSPSIFSVNTDRDAQTEAKTSMSSLEHFPRVKRSRATFEDDHPSSPFSTNSNSDAESRAETPVSPLGRLPRAKRIRTNTRAESPISPRTCLPAWRSQIDQNFDPYNTTIESPPSEDPFFEWIDVEPKWLPDPDLS